MHITKKLFQIIRKFIIFSILCSFLGTTAIPVQAQAVLVPAPISVSILDIMLRGVKLNPQNPLEFEFIVGADNATLQDTSALRSEAQKLIQYFLAGLTVPEDELWVNLSPYEANRIIADGLGKTGMGRDLLGQDYILKQIASSMFHPDGEQGKKFWKEMYTKAYQQFHTTELPYESFHKVWIVPNKAVIYEGDKSAYVVESSLKIMLEQDYAAQDYSSLKGDSARWASDDLDEEELVEARQMSTDMMRTMIIPLIEKQVNEGEQFAPLRQIYNSLVLAVWYKNKLKESIITKVYSDKNMTGGIEHGDSQVVKEIYSQYVEAFKDGAFNFVREEQDHFTDQIVPRKYFSGGADFAQITKTIQPTFIAPQGTQTEIAIRAQARQIGSDAAMNGQEMVERSSFFRKMKTLSYERTLRSAQPQLAPQFKEITEGFNDETQYNIFTFLSEPMQVENLNENIFDQETFQKFVRGMKILIGNSGVGEEAVNKAFQIVSRAVIEAAIRVANHEEFEKTYSQVAQNYFEPDFMQQTFVAMPERFVGAMETFSKTTELGRVMEAVNRFDSESDYGLLKQSFGEDPSRTAWSIRQIAENFDNYSGIVRTLGLTNMSTAFYGDPLEFISALGEVFRNSQKFEESLANLSRAGISKESLVETFVELPYFTTVILKAFEDEKGLEVVKQYIKENGELDINGYLEDRQVKLVFNNREVSVLNASEGLIRLLNIKPEHVRLGYRSDQIEKTIYSRYGNQFERTSSIGDTENERVVDFRPWQYILHSDYSEYIHHSDYSEYIQSFRKKMLPLVPYKFFIEQHDVSGQTFIPEPLSGKQNIRSVTMAISPNVSERNQVIEAHLSIPEERRPILILALPDADYELKNSLEEKGLKVISRDSKSGQVENFWDTDVVVLNTRGEVFDALDKVDSVILGQDRNPFEPAIQGVPILYFQGTWRNNKRAIRLLKFSGGAVPILNNGNVVENLAEQWMEMHTSTKVRDGIKESLRILNEKVRPAARLLGGLSVIAMVEHNQQKQRKLSVDSKDFAMASANQVSIPVSDTYRDVASKVQALLNDYVAKMEQLVFQKEDVDDISLDDIKQVVDISKGGQADFERKRIALRTGQEVDIPNGIAVKLMEAFPEEKRRDQSTQLLFDLLFEGFVESTDGISLSQIDLPNGLPAILMFFEMKQNNPQVQLRKQFIDMFEKRIKRIQKAVNSLAGQDALRALPVRKIGSESRQFMLDPQAYDLAMSWSDILNYYALEGMAAERGIITRNQMSKGKILTIGSAATSFVSQPEDENLVDYLRSKGRDVIGLDPAFSNDVNRGYVQGVVQNMPAEWTDSFDQVIAMHFFNAEFFDDLRMVKDGYENAFDFYRDAAKEIRRVLKEDGKVFIGIASLKNSQFFEAFNQEFGATHELKPIFAQGGLFAYMPKDAAMVQGFETKSLLQQVIDNPGSWIKVRDVNQEEIEVERGLSGSREMFDQEGPGFEEALNLLNGMVESVTRMYSRKSESQSLNDVTNNFASPIAMRFGVSENQIDSSRLNTEDTVSLKNVGRDNITQVSLAINKEKPFMWAKNYLTLLEETGITPTKGSLGEQIFNELKKLEIVETDFGIDEKIERILSQESNYDQQQRVINYKDSAMSFNQPNRFNQQQNFDDVGGIDLNPAAMDMQTQSDGQGFDFDPAQINIDPGTFKGFTPVILDVIPVTNLPLFLGSADNGSDDRLAQG